MEKVRGRANRQVREDSPMSDEAEVEKSFWLSRPDGWVINRKMKRIILLEFKRTSDAAEAYFQDMWKVAEKQHTPILTGVRALTEDRGWEVEVVPLVGRLDHTLLVEHEKLFDSYWRHTFGPSSSLLQLLGKGISVRASRSPQGG